MNRLLPVFLLAAPGLAAPARADTVVEAGQTLALQEDLVLTGKDSLDIRGMPNARCTLVGNGHRIRSSGAWTGSVRIRHCDLRQLGAPARLTEDKSRVAVEFPAVDLTITGTGALVVEHCVLDGCAAVHVQNDGQSTTTFRGNTILENTLAQADKDLARSSPCFVARGNAPARKLFQGNRIYRSQARFTGTTSSTAAIGWTCPRSKCRPGPSSGACATTSSATSRTGTATTRARRA
jgi:hypothetical protein